MRYYLKHLRRAIARRPAQPLVIILVLLLAFTVTFVSVSAANGIEDDNALKNEAAGGNAVTVSASASSSLPFVSAAPLQTSGLDVSAVGTFSMPLTLGQTVVQGYALDWDNAGAVFPQSFEQCTAVSAGERAGALFVTKVFADTYAYQIGDEIAFRLYGYDLYFTIRGYFDTPILGDGDVTCDLGALLSAYCDASGLRGTYPFLTDDFLSAVCGKLYVKSPSYTTQALEEALQALYPEAVVAPVVTETADNGFGVFTVIPAVITAFTFMIALVVSVSCLWCLAKQRREYALLFSFVGFSPRRALLCRIIEMLLYTLPAMGIGTLVSIPIGRRIFAGMGLSFAEFHLSWQAFLPAALILLFVATLSPVLADLRTPQRRRALPTGRLALCCCIITLLSGGAAFFVPVARRFWLAIPAVFLLFITICLLTRTAFTALFAHLCKKRRMSVPQELAVKNGVRVGELVNAARLLCVLLTAVLCLGFLSFSSRRMMTLTGQTLTGDYLISGSEAVLTNVKQSVEAMNETDGVYPVRVWNAETASGERAFFLGITDTAVLGYDFGDTLILPAAGDVAAAAFIADARGFALDETFAVSDTVQTKTLRLTQTVSTSMPQMITHYDTLQGAPTYLVVSGSAGVPLQTLYEALQDVTAGQAVEILPVDSLFGAYVRDMTRYVFFVRFMMALLCAFGCIGIGNNLCESIRSRREEFDALLLCGMTRRQVNAMLLYENLYVLLFAVLAALPALLFVIPVLNLGLTTYSTDCIQIILDCIRLHL